MQVPRLACGPPEPSGVRFHSPRVDPKANELTSESLRAGASGLRLQIPAREPSGRAGQAGGEGDYLVFLLRAQAREQEQKRLRE